MIQDIIAYIIIAVAVIIAVRMLLAGFMKKNNFNRTKDEALNKQLPFGSGCWQCTSKCALYNECKERF